MSSPLPVTLWIYWEKKGILIVPETDQNDLQLNDNLIAFYHE